MENFKWAKKICPKFNFWFFNENWLVLIWNLTKFPRKVGKMTITAIFIILLFQQKCLNILQIGGADGISWKWHFANFPWKYVKFPIKTNQFSLKNQKLNLGQIFYAHLKFVIFGSLFWTMNWFLSSIAC